MANTGSSSFATPALRWWPTWRLLTRRILPRARALPPTACSSISPRRGNPAKRFRNSNGKLAFLARLAMHFIARRKACQVASRRSPHTQPAGLRGESCRKKTASAAPSRGGRSHTPSISDVCVWPPAARRGSGLFSRRMTGSPRRCDSQGAGANCKSRPCGAARSEGAAAWNRKGSRRPRGQGTRTAMTLP